MRLISLPIPYFSPNSGNQANNNKPKSVSSAEAASKEESARDLACPSPVINFLSDDVAYFDGSSFREGYDKKGEGAEASLENHGFAITVSRDDNEPMLAVNAHGRCRTLALYNPNAKTGALLHFESPIYKGGDKYQAALAKLFKAVPALKEKDTQAILFGDFNIEDFDAEHVHAQKQFHSDCLNYLKQDCGFTKVREFTQGDGQAIELMTSNGHLRVEDEHLDGALLKDGSFEEFFD